MQDPVITILDLLDTNWNTGNTSVGYKPSLHTGWHSSDANSPQVTVTNPDEGPINGGETGFSAVQADGNTGQGVQTISGTVNVDCWSDRDVESGVNPKQLTYEFTEETKRIVKSATLTATDLSLVSYGGRRFVPPGPDENPPVFHYTVPISYLYTELP